MKHFKQLFALVGLLVAGFQIPLFAQYVHDEHPEGCNKARAMSQLMQLRGLNTFEDHSYDLKYYRFEWTIDPAVYAIGGKATAWFTANQDALSVMEFNLSTALTVSSVKYHGQDIIFSQNGDYGLTVNLPTPLANGTLDSLSISYQGVPPSGGFGSFIQSTHNGTPILWTLSEPFGAQDWWPCKNGLTDKIDSIDIYVTTPAQYRAASNGLLAEETTSGNQKTYHWKHRYAIAPYLVAISVTDYVQYTDNVLLSNGVEMPMLNYVYPESLQQAQQGTGNLVQVLQYFDSLFVTYPFYQEKYGHAQFGWGGGMEHQTMSFVVHYDWGLLAHELAHQWFGDMVTCGSWEDIWLNEGFATFLEGLTRQRFNQAAQWQSWRASKINQICGQPGGSVMVDDTTSVGRIFSGRLSYSKGAFLLHMLRWKLGDDIFFQGVRTYLQDRKFNYAVTPSLIAHLETASGQDLTEYFNDWYYGQGFPSYQINWDNAENTIVLEVSQLTSHSSVSFFEMPLPILVNGANGQSAMLRLDHTTNGQVFTADLPFKPVSITFDPDLWLLSNNNTIQKTELTGTHQPLSALDIRLTPNPAVTTAQLTLNIPAGQPLTWKMLGADGRLLQSGTLTNRVTEIPVTHLPSGTYQVIVQDNTGAMTARTLVK